MEDEHEGLVRPLIENGANFTLKDKDEYVMNLAAWYGHEAVM